MTNLITSSQKRRMEGWVGEEKKRKKEKDVAHKRVLHPESEQPGPDAARLRHRPLLAPAVEAAESIQDK